jgi:hypothetical protein
VRIVRASEGLPYYLDLAVEQYETMRNVGEPIELEAFGATPAGVCHRRRCDVPHRSESGADSQKASGSLRV